MATKGIVSQERDPIVVAGRAHGRIVVTWDMLANGDEGTPFEPPVGYDLESMLFRGSFGGGTAQIQGSNNGTQYGNVGKTSITSGGIVFPEGQVTSYRPQLSGGSGGSVEPVALFRQRS